MAGEILQDRDNSANLDQVNKFNSTNQNICSDAGFTLESFRTENYSAKHTYEKETTHCVTGGPKP